MFSKLIQLPLFFIFASSCLATPQDDIAHHFGAMENGFEVVHNKVKAYNGEFTRLPSIDSSYDRLDGTIGSAEAAFMNVGRDPTEDECGLLSNRTSILGDQIVDVFNTLTIKSPQFKHPFITSMFKRKLNQRANRYFAFLDTVKSQCDEWERESFETSIGEMHEAYEQTVRVGF